MCLCVFSPKASNEALYSQVVRLRCGIKLRPGNKQLTGGEEKKKKTNHQQASNFRFWKEANIFVYETKQKKKPWTTSQVK